MPSLKILRYALLFVMFFSMGSAQAAPNSHTLEVGDIAPNFNLIGSDGKQYQLSDFRDKQFVVLAFFPKAFTGG